MIPEEVTWVRFHARINAVYSIAVFSFSILYIFIFTTNFLKENFSTRSSGASEYSTHLIDFEIMKG